MLFKCVSETVPGPPSTPGLCDYLCICFWVHTAPYTHDLNLEVPASVYAKARRIVSCKSSCIPQGNNDVNQQTSSNYDNNVALTTILSARNDWGT